MKRISFPVFCVILVLCLGVASMMDERLEKWCGIAALAIGLLSAFWAMRGEIND
jgi:hypothetical protein